MSTLNFRHIGIVVKNIEKQMYFYKDLLGLELYSEDEEFGDYIDFLFNDNNIKLKTHKLGNQGNVIIELLKFERKTKTNKQKIDLFTSGITHFAISVNNIDELYEKLTNNNIEFINKPTVSKNKLFKVCFCKDFEGNCIELVQKI
jgi:catechol 2,3-dioxygenase-like lactoylglutathione lyase family enzyme